MFNPMIMAATRIAIFRTAFVVAISQSGVRSICPIYDLDQEMEYIPDVFSVSAPNHIGVDECEQRL